uniref:Uncharacterized protein n=1 Tax=Aegilops tauschii subsp. strangulata TaxID=200361 RepID=A0A453AKM5_AEGTS
MLWCYCSSFPCLQRGAFIFSLYRLHVCMYICTYLCFIHFLSAQLARSGSYN